MNELLPDEQLYADGFLPVREVTRITGVLPVTLRAWERRYGLIKPVRSNKGHRLYSPEQVERIRAVLAWLERGVAVGQVKPLLDGAQALEPVNDHWREQQQALLQCVGQLAEGRLEERFNALSALYPAETLCRQLLMPLLAQVQQQANQSSGQRLELVFLRTWLRSKLSFRLHQSNCLNGVDPVLLVNLDESCSDLSIWLSAWLLSHAGCNVRVLDGPLAAAELAAAVNQVGASAVLLHSSQCLDLAYLQRSLQRLSCPAMLCGAAVQIHAQALSQLNHLALAMDPLEALESLRHLGWIQLQTQVSN